MRFFIGKNEKTILQFFKEKVGEENVMGVPIVHCI